MGRAWVEPDGTGGWRRRRGRAPEDCVDRREAERLMDALIDQTERSLADRGPNREATFADAVAEWRDWAEHTKRLKPATLRNYDALLSAPGQRAREGARAWHGSCAPSESARSLISSTAEVERFLRGLDREGMPGRM